MTPLTKGKSDMMELGIWQIIKTAVECIVLPLFGVIAYFFNRYIQRVEAVEKRVGKIEVRMAIVEVNISHIREDIEDIKKGIEKLIDRK